jgi:two-component system, chemotaxis family, CheB/CheR fusion protein
MKMSEDTGERSEESSERATRGPDATEPQTSSELQDGDPFEAAEELADGAAGSSGLVVVGVGASAGGLEALQALFGNMQSDANVAFVVVTHQAPNRTSLLPMLLSKRTSMPVSEVVDGARIKADHVYVAPPGRNLALLNGRLHTSEAQQGARHLPINHFFRSLARDQKERAIGVVLSGTGTDGTLGLKEIKAGLGLSIVQEESDAAFSGMPHSAITGDSPDFILPADEIPVRIVSYLRNLRLSHAHRLAAEDSSRAADALSRIFVLLRQRTGHDFSAYKESTVRRRIERRMNVQRLTSVTDYAGRLQADAAELEVLFDELLIGVTSFFRDPDAFVALERLLTEYLAGKPDGYALRVWVAGCSTGEEAYSLAIVASEVLERLRKHMQVQIFATDLDGKAIERARVGFYPLGIAGDVSPERLRRFFVQHEHGYQVTKELRELLVFATQSLTEDPPFTKLDFLSCRNLLIYLDGTLQRRLFPMFHYVLRPGGMLLLGSSETIGNFGNLFAQVDKKWRLYQRREVPGGTYTAELPTSASLEAGLGGPPASTPRRHELGMLQQAEKLLLRELVPPTVFMRERGEILHIHGRTGLFLEPAPGPQSSANIYNMAREGLHLELSAAVREASREGTDVLRRGVRVRTDGHTTYVDLRVKRLTEPESFRGLFRVTFERPRTAQPAQHELDAEGKPPTRVLELERELQYTKESHQGTIEELETANEELKSTNEELQSTNEELQSANEELETSKEELQSLNEELQTVNLELQSNVEELSRANDDMTNLLNATDIATIFLDNELNIKRHTEQAKHVIRLIPSDVGRSIGDLVSRLRYGRLLEDAREVLRTLVFKEVELQGEGDGKWYLMRILPYRTIDNLIDGLVVTFVDITRVKQLQLSEQRLLGALRHSPVSVFGVGADLRCTWAYSSVFGHDGALARGKPLGELVDVEQAALTRLVERTLESGIAKREQVVIKVRGRDCRYDVYVEAHRDEGGEPRATCVAVQLS